MYCSGKIVYRPICKAVHDDAIFIFLGFYVDSNLNWYKNIENLISLLNLAC